MWSEASKLRKLFKRRIRVATPKKKVNHSRILCSANCGCTYRKYYAKALSKAKELADNAIGSQFNIYINEISCGQMIAEIVRNELRMNGFKADVFYSSPKDADGYPDIFSEQSGQYYIRVSF